MEDSLAKLERIQTQIIERISKLELSTSASLQQFTATPIPTSTQNAAVSANEARLSAILLANDVKNFAYKRVPSDYYDWSLDARRDALGAASIHHLCKSIILVVVRPCLHSPQSSVVDCSDSNNSKYYVVVFQYTARFNAEAVKNFLYSLNEGKIAKKKFNCQFLSGSVHIFLAILGFSGRTVLEMDLCMKVIVVVIGYALRLAPEDKSIELTGFEHNAVTCVGMKTDIPVILDEAIEKLNPDFFWLGGGEVDLKLGIRTSEFINFAKPFIVSCSSS
ncbi:hypothetical protein EV1_031995 [Malus domestica]